MKKKKLLKKQGGGRELTELFSEVLYGRRLASPRLSDEQRRLRATHAHRHALQQRRHLAGERETRRRRRPGSEQRRVGQVWAGGRRHDNQPTEINTQMLNKHLPTNKVVN